MVMITKKMLNGSSGKLMLRGCNVPFHRVGRTFRIMYFGDTIISGERPSMGDMAIPNGYGYWHDNTYLFRRVDRVWIAIDDDNLAKLVDVAVSQWSGGIDLSFEELQGLEGVDAKYLTVAYSTGILGPCGFQKEPEQPDNIVIENGWFEDNLMDYAVYRDGLALYETYTQDLPHITTAYRLHKPVLKAKMSRRGLKAGDVLVQDANLIEIAEMCEMRETVGGILDDCGELYRDEVAWGLAVLVGLGCVDLISPWNNKAQSQQVSTPG